MTLQGMTIQFLLVEDNPANAEYAKQVAPESVIGSLKSMQLT